jgi:alkanesulfonate monooxygenase SsuD/methylene tetrahydromethanopterin reductase-like flavin-dependent oxidoreductase (luciferase family)
MTDYGHELVFGTFLTPTAAQADRVIALAQLTEQVGLDLVTVQDHPYQPAFLDTWTLLSVIAARTERVRVAANVANLPLRPPVVMARSVASLDIISGGRVELGLGAGGFRDAIAAAGGPRLTPGESVEALEEAIRIIREVWTTDRGGIRLDGKHYSVVGAKRGPAPAHDVEIWLGAVKPRMLSVTGRLADGWLPSSSWAGPDELPEMNEMIDRAALDAGRKPSDIRRLYNLMGQFDDRGNGFLQGPERLWIEQLTELALAHGMSTFILASDSPDDIRRFAEVAPAVREAVAAGRTGSAAPAPAADVPAVDGFDVVPTPDDGVRLSAVQPWDESTRPTGPAPEAGRTYTAGQRAAGQHLIDVHDHLRAELDQVRDLVEQVAAGSIEVGQARSEISTMTMRQNNWTLGAYCESYCRVVTMHHSLEDQAMLPQLRYADPRLAPVVDRLDQEHRVIHEVLEGVDRSLVALINGSGDIAGLRDSVDLLSDSLLSHLSYEERELVEPLARFGFA